MRCLPPVGLSNRLGVNQTRKKTMQRHDDKTNIWANKHGRPAVYTAPNNTNYKLLQ